MATDQPTSRTGKGSSSQINGSSASISEQHTRPAPNLQNEAMALQMKHQQLGDKMGLVFAHSALLNESELALRQYHNLVQALLVENNQLRVENQRLGQNQRRKKPTPAAST